jgi:hypothetical protein
MPPWRVVRPISVANNVVLPAPLRPKTASVLSDGQKVGPHGYGSGIVDRFPLALSKADEAEDTVDVVAPPAVSIGEVHANPQVLKDSLCELFEPGQLSKRNTCT